MKKMGLMERRNELLVAINLLMRKNMKDEDRRKELYKLLKQYEAYVVDVAVENAVNRLREGIE